MEDDNECHTANTNMWHDSKAQNHSVYSRWYMFRLLIYLSVYFHAFLSPSFPPSRQTYKYLVIYFFAFPSTHLSVSVQTSRYIIICISYSPVTYLTTRHPCNFLSTYTSTFLRVHTFLQTNPPTSCTF